MWNREKDTLRFQASTCQNKIFLQNWLKILEWQLFDFLKNILKGWAKNCLKNFEGQSSKNWIFQTSSKKNTNKKMENIFPYRFFFQSKLFLMILLPGLDSWRKPLSSQSNTIRNQAKFLEHLSSAIRQRKSFEFWIDFW